MLIDELEYIQSISSELAKHRGKWLVVVGDDLVYTGQDVKKGYNEAKRKYPGKSPFIIQIPKEEVMLLSF